MSDKISEDEFYKRFAERSGMTIEWMREHGHAVPCDCDDPRCEGWVMDSPISWVFDA